MQAVILAGGRGERLRPITDSVPKPMVPINGRPFLSHLLAQLKRHNVDRVLILTGYLSHVIEHYFQDKNSCPEGVLVTVRSSVASLIGGARILEAESELESEFVLLYGDNYARFSLEELRLARNRFQAHTTLSVFRKSPGDLAIYGNGVVRDFSGFGRTEGFDYVELGYMLVNKEMLLGELTACNGDLRQAIREQVVAGRVNSVEIEHPYFSVSDPARLTLASEALSDRRVLILDRDGVLNVKPPTGEYVTSRARWYPIEENWQAIKQLSAEGFSFVIVTNQAALEIGSLTKKNLEGIHNEIRERFHGFGAELLGIYVCPHHWDSSCECRKPKPGLLHQAALEHNLVLDNIMMVGDQLSDWEAAQSAGCRPIMVGSKGDGVVDSSDCFSNLNDALGTIRRYYRAGRDTGFG